MSIKLLQENYFYLFDNIAINIKWINIFYPKFVSKIHTSCLAEALLEKVSIAHRILYKQDETF